MRGKMMIKSSKWLNVSVCVLKSWRVLTFSLLDV